MEVKYFIMSYILNCRGVKVQVSSATLNISECFRNSYPGTDHQVCRCDKNCSNAWYCDKRETIRNYDVNTELYLNVNILDMHKVLDYIAGYDKTVDMRLGNILTSLGIKH